VLAEELVESLPKRYNLEGIIATAKVRRWN
jgi:hypothetical protein